MVEILCADNDDERRDVVHRAVQCLADGNRVGIPLETGYVAGSSALVATPAAADSGSHPQEDCVLVARSPLEAADFLTRLPAMGRRLIRRFWPGPIILETDRSMVNGLFDRLSASTRDSIRTNAGEIRFSVSGNPLFQEIGRLLSGPVVVSGMQQAARSAEELTATHVDLALAIDDGAPTLDGRPSIVGWQDRSWILRNEGVVSRESLQRMSATVILFVCTGNTCRSPMAEGLCRRLLADRAGCSDADLSQHGFVIASAGLAAGYGSPASQESAQLMQARAIDLSAHESQPLTERLLTHADFVYTMTRGHRSAILAERPELEGRVQVLARDGSDIPDPIGGGLDEYQRCLAAIEQHLQAILSELPPVES